MTSIFESIGTYHNLEDTDQAYIKRWGTELLPLVEDFQYSLDEAQMSRDQVLDMFKRIEVINKDSWKNRTALGKAVDLVKLPNTIINKLGELIKDTRPIKNADAAFEKAKSAIRGSLGEEHALIQLVDWYGNFARQHPVASGAVIGILTTAAAATTGPAAGPIVGAILRAGTELLKGTKFSTAVGRSLKTGLLGLTANWGIEQAADMFVDVDVDLSKVPGYNNIYKWHAYYDLGGQKIFDIDTYIPVEFQSSVDNLFAEAKEAAAMGDLELANSKFKSLYQSFDSPEWRKAMSNALAHNKELRDKALASAAKSSSLIKNLTIIVDGIIAASTGGSGGSLRETQELDEVVVKNILSSVSTWAKNLTNKITAEKLINAWQKAGSPTDSDQLAKFLTAQGLDSSILDQYVRTSSPEKSKQQPKKVQTKTKTEKTVATTGDPELDKLINTLVKKHGQQAVAKMLRNYKSTLGQKQ